MHSKRAELAHACIIHELSLKYMRLLILCILAQGNKKSNQTVWIINFWIIMGKHDLYILSSFANINSDLKHLSKLSSFKAELLEVLDDATQTK
jgi:hypothetical protein